MFVTECEKTLKLFQEELRILEGWTGEVEKLRKDMDLVGAVNIVERDNVTNDAKGMATNTLLATACPVFNLGCFFFVCVCQQRGDVVRLKTK